MTGAETGHQLSAVLVTAHQGITTITGWVVGGAHLHKVGQFY